MGIWQNWQVPVRICTSVVVEATWVRLQGTITVKEST